MFHRRDADPEGGIVACVGIIANPASGKDIRRLVAHGSVFNNNEKVNIVRRVMLGLDAVGVDRIVTMPDTFNICGKAQDNLQLKADVQPLDMPMDASQRDTTRAAQRMRDLGIDCLVSLGGDGTNRALAKTCGAIPLMPLSTGTNNVFPYMLEGTLAGLAAGLVASGAVAASEAVEQRPCLEIEVNGDATDIALVDAVVCDDLFVASRAVWDMTKVRMVIVAQRMAAQIGFMGLAGNLQRPGAPDGGMVIETDPQAPPVLVPIAPGLIQGVGVRRYAALDFEERVELPAGRGTIALDGEREIVMRPHDCVAVHLRAAGPRVVQPQKALTLAAEQGFFMGERGTRCQAAT